MIKKKPQYFMSEKGGEQMPEGEITKGLRYRVNVSTSVKGIKTWDCTVDGEGFDMGEILERSDELVAELEKRYPFEVKE